MKAKCIRANGYNLTFNKVYNITHIYRDWVKLNDDTGEEVEAYANRFNVVNEVPTMEEHITKAQELVGKNLISGNNSKFIPESVYVFLKGNKSGHASTLVYDALKTSPYVVALYGGGVTVPYEQCKLLPTQVTVKLNDKYSAVVTNQTITVGCQTFPVSIVEELTKAINSLK
jgi:hypothetical protein